MIFAPPSSIYSREIEAETFILNSISGRYSKISGKTSRVFQQILRGDLLSADDAGVMTRLLEMGLLERSENSYAQPIPPMTPAMSAEKLRPAYPDLRLIWQYSMYLALVKTLSFGQLQSRLSEVKTAFEPNPTNHELGIARVLSALAVADACIGRNGRCLPRAIAIWRALMRQGVSTQLILGIKTLPFEAHAWVQHGAIVVGDDVDAVELFSPIFAL